FGAGLGGEERSYGPAGALDTGLLWADSRAHRPTRALRRCREKRDRTLGRYQMTARIRRQGNAGVTIVALVVLAASVVVATRATVQAAETPRRGGVLLAVIGADPPSLDPHQESTFANIQLVAPLYSTLLQIDPYGYPKIVGDAASEWKIAPDWLTYTFKIRHGIRFHDGSPLTAADVKATYDKIVSPPAG